MGNFSLFFVYFLLGSDLLELTLWRPPLFIERYEGTARDSQEKVVYLEKHEVEYQNGQVARAITQYLDQQGSFIAELRSDFPKGAYLPNYSFKNFKTQLDEGVQCCQASELEVFYQGKRKKLRFDPSWVSGQGFHYLVKDRLTTIDQGAMEHFRFLIPAKLEAYPFRLRSAGRDPKNPQNERIYLEIDQWFFRIFAPKIIATYDLSSKRLVRYEGPSNILNADGKIMKVTIDYTYPR